MKAIPITPNILAQINAIKNTGHAGKPWHNFFGLLLVVIGVYWAAWKFTEHRSAGSSLTLGKHKAFALVGSAILVQTALMKIGFTFGDSVAAQNAGAIQRSRYLELCHTICCRGTAGGDAG